jgi:hypothetical protein
MQQQRKLWNGPGHRLAASGISVLTIDDRGFRDKLSASEEGEIEARNWPGDIDVAFACRDWRERRPGGKAALARA